MSTDLPGDADRSIVIWIRRPGPAPHEVLVEVDGGDLDVIALRAYIEDALDGLNAVADDEDDDA